VRSRTERGTAASEKCEALLNQQTEYKAFNVSPCIFRFNNWWIHTHAPFHIQHCISL